MPPLSTHAPSDPVEGERAFQVNCANCHGAKGDLVPGIDLGRGRFRRPLSDEELIGIIRTGIPNSPMPATNITLEQVAGIVAYLRSLARAIHDETTGGNPGRGRALFVGKAGCTDCHRISGSGSRVGPNFTTIGAVRRTADLEQSLLDPQAEVQPAHRFYRVALRDGTVIAGRLLSHDTFIVQVLDTNERLRSFVKGDLSEHGFTTSPMPSYRDRLTLQEIADLVSYLASLRP